MQDLTAGSIARNMLKMTSFVLVSMVFQTLYFLIDLYFVGRLGRDAVAAVSVSGNLTFIVIAASQMLSVGTTSLVAQAVGRREQKEARLLFNQSQTLGFVIGAVFFVGVLLLRDGYAKSQAADAATAALVIDYLIWFVPAMALQFPIAAATAALRGTGNFKPGMLIQSGTVLLNIVLAPVLILGWGTGHPLGVAGAGLSTFISVVPGLIVLFIYITRAEKYLRFAPADLPPVLPLWGRMLKIGLPAGAEFILMGAYVAIVYAISRPFGAAAQAGFGIGLRVVQAAFMPVVALGMAASPVAGQNFGAHKAERVRETFRVGALMACGYMAILTLLCVVVPEALVGVFSQDVGVVSMGGGYLHIVAWTFLPSGIVFVSSSMFQALGNTIPPLLSSFSRILIAGGPALVLSRLPGFQLRWVWFLAVASAVVQVSANLVLLRREFARKLGFAPPPAAATAA
jgi:putative MATE family efflux protein